MARYKDVTFSDGTEVRIYSPPSQRIRAMVEAKYPKPEEPTPPVVTETGVAGNEISMEIKDDPEYLQRHRRWEKVEMPEWNSLIVEETDRRGSLFVFKDLEVPEDWDVETEVGAIVRLDEPDWEPTPGELGRKRDYIQWVLLSDPEDSMLVQGTLMGLAGMSQEGVDAFMASFRDQVEGAATK